MITVRYYSRVALFLGLFCVFGVISGCRKTVPKPSEKDTSKSTSSHPENFNENGELVLRLLVWDGYEPKKYVDKFEKYIETKYGKSVKMEFVYIKSDDDFYDAIRDKSVGLVSMSHYMIKDERFNFIDKKLILPFNPENIPNFKNVIPELQRADYHVSDEKIYGVPIASGPYGLAYNTSKVKAPPNSWGVFWQPQYKGKYALSSHEYIYNINVTALAMGYPGKSIGSYEALNNKEFKDRLRQLALNAGSFWSGVEKAENLFGKSIAMVWGDSFSSLARMGETWKMADPKEGTMWWVDEYVMTWAISDKPFLKKVSEEWVNQSLSIDFQVNHIFRELHSYPVVMNISDKVTDEEKEFLGINGTPLKFSQKRIMQRTYTERDRNGLRELWNQAMEGIPVE